MNFSYSVQFVYGDWEYKHSSSAMLDFILHSAPDPTFEDGYKGENIMEIC